MEQNYSRLKTPEEVLNEKRIELTELIFKLGNDVDDHHIENENIKEEFAREFSNLRNSLQLTKTALAKSVPPVEKFLRSLRLGKYTMNMKANKLTVKKLIQIRGDLSTFDDPPITMKKGHYSKMLRGLFNVSRVMDFNYKYIERRADLEKQRRADEEKKEKQALALETVPEDGEPLLILQDGGSSEVWDGDGGEGEGGSGCGSGHWIVEENFVAYPNNNGEYVEADYMYVEGEECVVDGEYADEEYADEEYADEEYTYTEGEYAEREYAEGEYDNGEYVQGQYVEEVQIAEKDT